jgi:hypothetical protein
MTRSPLDRAFAEADAPGATEVARARAYALLLETELCAPVAEGAPDAPPSPLVFDLSEGPVALAFDGDARMAGFFGRPTAFVSLPGRALAALLAEAGLGLALNADCETAVLPAETVAWIVGEMAGPPDAADLSGALVVGPPDGAPESLLAALAERLAGWPGLVAEAWLVRLGAEAGASDLALALVPAPAAFRAAEGLCAALAARAEPYAPPGETVAVGALREGHPILNAARAQGIGLHPGRATNPASEAAPPRTPPKLR